MNIRRIIDKNRKLIGYFALIIVFIFIAIRSLNTQYEKREQLKKEELIEKQRIEEEKKLNPTEGNYTTASNYIEETMESFINYCNNRETEKAYRMLTQECKDAMFPTIELFEDIYLDNIYNTKKTYEFLRWTTNGNRETYLVTLYGDILATGGKENSIQEYYTFIKGNNGVYKLNINNYIYGEDRNRETKYKNVTVKIGHVDVYDEYETVELIITNNTSQKICITGDKYKEKMYLQDSKEIKYQSINSELDYEEIVINPEGVRTLIIDFNKVYNSGEQAKYLVLSDVIFDYENYLQSEDKENYTKRSEIKVNY